MFELLSLTVLCLALAGLSMIFGLLVQSFAWHVRHWRETGDGFWLQQGLIVALALAGTSAMLAMTPRDLVTVQLVVGPLMAALGWKSYQWWDRCAQLPETA